MGGVTAKATTLREMGYRLIALAELEEAQGDEHELPAEEEPSENARRKPSSWVYDPAILTQLAERIYKLRRRRDQFLDHDLLGEPFWDILLDLYIQYRRGKLTSITSSCTASGVASTTALRHIKILEDRGLLVRSQCDQDARVKYVRLTDQAVKIMEKYLAYSLTRVDQDNRKASSLESYLLGTESDRQSKFLLGK